MVMVISVVSLLFSLFCVVTAINNIDDRFDAIYFGVLSIIFLAISSVLILC